MNIIVSDEWGRYAWLNNSNSGYLHSTHTHGLGVFVTGDENTSHIEQLWAHLNLIKKNF